MVRRDEQTDRLSELKKRQKEIKALIKKIETAISNTADENIHSYEIDTGPESRYALERPKLSDLMKTRATLQAELSEIQDEISSMEEGGKKKAKRIVVYFPR